MRLSAYQQRICQTYNKRVIPHTFQACNFVWKKIKPMGDVEKLEAQLGGPSHGQTELRSILS